MHEGLWSRRYSVRQELLFILQNTAFLSFRTQRLRQYVSFLPAWYIFTFSLDLELCDPVEVLEQKHAWLRAPEHQKEPMQKQTGVTFTKFD